MWPPRCPFCAISLEARGLESTFYEIIPNERHDMRMVSSSLLLWTKTTCLSTNLFQMKPPELIMCAILRQKISKVLSPLPPNFSVHHILRIKLGTISPFTPSYSYTPPPPPHHSLPQTNGEQSNLGTVNYTCAQG